MDGSRVGLTLAAYSLFVANLDLMNAMYAAVRVLCLFTLFAGALCAQDVSFSRDVLPVLSDRCFHCHGPDEGNREADLRLDLEGAAKADRGGYAVIVPGSLNDSELWRRVTSDDEDVVMPPADSHRKPLDGNEREAIRKWILSGAKWGKHWSFQKLERPALPSNEHPVDAWVKARLDLHNLKLSRPAPPYVQLRRLSLDLTGLSPSLEDVEQFGDGTDEAWAAAIDRLLKSPRYAERMAMWWLDAARYSDSDGFQIDSTRQNWPWRDWVIQQFRDNKSFRDFTIEQFAGDLLPDATADQKLATCFHRNHMTNGEGGRDPEESRIDYVIDRVNTTGAVWLGLTLGCVQCHSHKFDPISHHDYYSMFAFFNSIDEDGKAGMNAKPYLDYESAAVSERIAEMSSFVERCRNEEVSERKLAKERFEGWLGSLLENKPAEYQAWWTPKPQVNSVEGTKFRIEEDATIQAYGPSPRQDDYRVTIAIPEGIERVTGFRIEVKPSKSHVAQRFSRGGNGEFSLTSVIATARRNGSPSERQLTVSRAIADVEADGKRKTDWDKRYGPISKTLNDDARDGWTTEGVEPIESHFGVFELAKPWRVESGDRFVVLMRHRSTHGHASIGRFRLSFTSELGETVRHADARSPIEETLQCSENGNAIGSKLKSRLLEQYVLGDAGYQASLHQLSRAKKQLAQLKTADKPRKVMVLKEREDPRKTHVLVRGVWDAKGDVVQPRVLPSVLKWPAGQSSSRLDLAHWIVDPKNPLTARVVVNHLWQILFGQGLVRTPEDFGLQGKLPTHPKLLDWLAVELIDHDWDLQHIIRLIVTSDTYRQSSAATAELRNVDPENELLARAPRFRLPAWMIRDNALHVSGLLNPAIGGPPVMPYQPQGVWSEITMGRFEYEPSVGPAQYRRTIYAFWRRSSAPAFLFDSAQRRVCEVGVRRTNTPLQALTLMNDQTMLEASRTLADSLVRRVKAPSDDQQRMLHELARRILSRELKPDEVRELHRVLSKALRYYQSDVKRAAQFCKVGQRADPKAELVADTAAWMTVASLLLNLDEAMTRE